MPRRPGVPAYRRRTVGGNAYAMVLLPHADGTRRAVHLGRHGSPESRTLYLRVIAEWQAGVAGTRRKLGPVGAAYTLAQLCADYEPTLATRSANHRANVVAAMRVALELYAEHAAELFGPAKLKLVRDAMRKPGFRRRGWSIDVANRMAGYIVGAFRWAAEHERIPPAVWHGLKALTPMRGGQRERVLPADRAAVDATLPLLTAPIAAMVRLQLLTGMRPGEVCAMRDLDRRGKVWLYTPTQHKGAYRGHVRTIYIGPKAQRVLRPWLRDSGYLFRPADGTADGLADRRRTRKTPAGRGNAPGTHRVASPRRKPGERYTVASYRRAIARACDAAGVARWHPHQLRHTAATEIRAKFGLEAAAIMLGHSSALVTEAVYAERDERQALRVARLRG